MNMQTIELFREDSYLKECEAEVLAVLTAAEIGDDSNLGTTAGADYCAIVTDKTVFYPEGGGQPGDTGVVTVAAETGETVTVQISDTQKRESAILHICAESPPAFLRAGAKVTMKINWQRRHRLMRMHSCMHMLCAAIPAAVTGGAIHEDSARIDFNLPNPPGKQELEDTLNRLVRENHPMKLRWISEAELDAQPELVRTMSVQPPRAAGRVRLVEFEGADLQPCGGTHVAASGEIGEVRVRSIKSKGKQNRRVTVVFA